ncbi:hypothetical protein [Buttiauxella gaviniae]|jgi:hypothetical protein|uniref:hypothetical protein n=1 Tax=Enterobacterales TaxID=91347 RepID=UPI0039B01EE5
MCRERDEEMKALGLYDAQRFKDIESAKAAGEYHEIRVEADMTANDIQLLVDTTAKVLGHTCGVTVVGM